MKIESIKCPHCNDPIQIDVYEYDQETGIPTETGYHFGCKDAILLEGCNYSYDELIVLQDSINAYLQKNRISVK